MTSATLQLTDSRQQRARELVMAYGWNATAYQIVNRGIAHWFSARGDAVAGYVDTRSVRVVAGAPVCDPARLGEVVEELERDSAAAGRRVCYFGAESRLESLLAPSPSHSQVLLGAQPTWTPARWPDVVRQRASLRAQFNRARNKGVAVEPVSDVRAIEHAALRRILDEWLDTRGLAPLHFLVEPNTLEQLADRRVFVATRDGSAIAFLVASPVPQRRGWLIEQIVRGREAVNGTNELLVDASIRALADAHAEYVTLGLSPLSAHVASAASENPLWLRAVLGWVRAHGRRFYNFEGLDRFKGKFAPERWEPVYAITNQRTFSLRALHAIAEAFSGGSPTSLVMRSLVRAAKMELRWLFA